MSTLEEAVVPSNIKEREGGSSLLDNSRTPVALASGVATGGAFITHFDANIFSPFYSPHGDTSGLLSRAEFSDMLLEGTVGYFVGMFAGHTLIDFLKGKTDCDRVERESGYNSIELRNTKLAAIDAAAKPGVKGSAILGGWLTKDSVDFNSLVEGYMTPITQTDIGASNLLFEVGEFGLGGVLFGALAYTGKNIWKSRVNKKYERMNNLK